MISGVDGRCAPDPIRMILKGVLLAQHCQHLLGGL